MRRNTSRLTGAAFALLFLGFNLNAGNPKPREVRISVDVTKPGHKISPTLFGVFFEDINLSADGGLYPELIRNRSFEDADTLQNWKFSGSDAKSKAAIINADVHSRPPVPPLNTFNRKSLLIDLDGSFRLDNSGYWGINLKQGEKYKFKMAARAVNGMKNPVKVKLIGGNRKYLSFR